MHICACAPPPSHAATSSTATKWGRVPAWVMAPASNHATTTTTIIGNEAGGWAGLPPVLGGGWVGWIAPITRRAEAGQRPSPAAPQPLIMFTLLQLTTQSCSLSGRHTYHTIIENRVGTQPTSAHPRSECTHVPGHLI